MTLGRACTVPLGELRGTNTQDARHTARPVDAPGLVPGPRMLQQPCLGSAVEQFKAQTLESDCLDSRPALPRAGCELLGPLLDLHMPSSGVTRGIKVPISLGFCEDQMRRCI